MPAAAPPKLHVNHHALTARAIPKPCVAGSNPAGGTGVMSRDTVHRCLATSFTVGLVVGSPGWGRG